MSAKRKKQNKIRLTRSVQATIIVLLLAVLGVVAARLSSAANYTVSQEAEFNIVSGNAGVEFNTAASGGKSVKFGKNPISPPTPTPTPPPPGTPPPAPSTQLRIYVTGYSWHDNTPPGSATVCCSILHKTADGQGTYEDPITTAVPGSGSNMERQAGTRYYLPSIKRYVLVEDSGATATSSYGSDIDLHLDVWIDGRDGSKGDTDNCMSDITGPTDGEENPPPGRDVIVGPIYNNGGCQIP